MYEYILTKEVKEFLYLYYPLKVPLIKAGQIEEFYSIYKEYILWYEKKFDKMSMNML